MVSNAPTITRPRAPRGSTGPLGIFVRTLRFWLHPTSSLLRWRWRLTKRWPRAQELQAMPPGQFERFVRDVGMEARIRAAVEASDRRAASPDRDARVPVGQGQPR